MESTSTHSNYLDNGPDGITRTSNKSRVTPGGKKNANVWESAKWCRICLTETAREWFKEQHGEICDECKKATEQGISSDSDTSYAPRDGERCVRQLKKHRKTAWCSGCRQRTRMSVGQSLTECCRAKLRRCLGCDGYKTEYWSIGPHGAGTLCKKCGAEWDRKKRRIEARAQCSTVTEEQNITDMEVTPSVRGRTQVETKYVFPYQKRFRMGRRKIDSRDVDAVKSCSACHRRAESVNRKRLTECCSAELWRCSHCSTMRTMSRRNGPKGRRTLSKPCHLHLRKRDRLDSLIKSKKRYPKMPRSAYVSCACTNLSTDADRTQSLHISEFHKSKDSKHSLQKNMLNHLNVDTPSKLDRGRQYQEGLRSIQLPPDIAAFASVDLVQEML